MLESVGRGQWKSARGLRGHALCGGWPRVLTTASHWLPAEGQHRQCDRAGQWRSSLREMVILVPDELAIETHRKGHFSICVTLCLSGKRHIIEAGVWT